MQHAFSKYDLNYTALGARKSIRPLPCCITRPLSRFCSIRLLFRKLWFIWGMYVLRDTVGRAKTFCWHICVISCNMPAGHWAATVAALLGCYPWINGTSYIEGYESFFATTSVTMHQTCRLSCLNLHFSNAVRCDQLLRQAKILHFFLI